MATVTFSTLPVEAHHVIASHCGNSDLFHLCLTANWVSERCLHLLYRHIVLRFNRHGVDLKHHREHFRRLHVHAKRQRQLVKALMTHPEYCNQVRSLTAKLYVPTFHLSHKDSLVTEELWRAMQSLTRVQSVNIGTIEPLENRGYSSRTARPYPTEFPQYLFCSATSVRLVGRMSYPLVMSILNGINPATLRHLYLDMVHDYSIDNPTGLLKSLTGRCTALRTLTLRMRRYPWETDPKGSSTECASFIRSVQGTVEKFTFEQATKSRGDTNPNGTRPLGMDQRFRRLILPAIVSGNWPRLTTIELRGVRGPTRESGNAALTAELRAALGEDTSIVVEEESY